MKYQLYLALAIVLAACNERSTPEAASSSAAKDVLLQQLRTTHSDQQWFATTNTALQGLTAEQAMWTDSSGNHSVGQLAYHIAFWNEQQLAKFKGLEPDAFSGDNNETFDAFTKEAWESVVKRVDSVSTEWEKAIETADEAKLKEWYGTLANINTHNAYHTGQIVYIRKMKGWWDPERG
ncbi:MAG: DinB family protein [Bacteroidia bacterium]|nr:DinB family protein [Bacteroidia bacterium]